MSEILERIAELPSVVKIFLSFAAVWYLYGYVRAARQDRQIRALGGYAPRWRSHVWGFDIIYKTLKAYTANEVLGFMVNNFKKFGHPQNPWTYELGRDKTRTIVTADHENIKAILATQFQDFGKGEEMHRQWYGFIGDGIFTTDGSKWHESRQLIRPQFVRDRLSNIQVFERHVSVLIPALKGNGETVDLSNLFFRFTLDAATDFLLGRSVDSLVSEQARFANAFDYVQHHYSLLTRVRSFEAFVPKRRVRRELKVLDDFINAYIDDALQLSAEELEKTSKSDENYNFLHAIAAYTRDRQILRDQIMSVLLAGRDTTACTLSWLFYELSVHPEITEKLRKEILAQLGPNKQPSYEDLKAMRYLQHTINEVLRLYPVVPFNMRFALRDTTLPRGGGPDGSQPIGVLQGTMIGYSTLIMQRREDIYPAPEKSFAPAHEFSPERWESWTPRSWQYVPFNGGPRICIGQQFALTEMAYTATRILQRFARIENRGNGHPRLKTDIVLAPATPIKIAFWDAESVEGSK